ncbi:MAG: hypothetical protein K2X47_09485 [Bdellovibrionales bacterium]|nr:hypothetical protein [Bdellovibrionales bacterium]
MLIVLLFCFRLHAGGTEQVSDLYSFFQASCPTQGEWTKKALNHTQSLISVFKSIQNDPDCKTLSGAISQLDFLALRLYDLQGNTSEREILALKKQQQTLLLQFSSNPSPEILPIIEQSLQTNQATLAQYLGYQDADRSVYRTSDGQMLRNLVISSNVLLTQAVANRTCLMKNPSVLSGISSVVGAVTAGALTSGASIGVSAAVNLFGSVLDFLRQIRIAGKINSLVQNMAAPAYDCVLESLTSQWCGAQDALSVIGAKTSALVGADSEDQVWYGLKILDRDLPIILHWLGTVEAGVDPTNQGQGNRQNKVLIRRQLVQSARPLGLGTINEKEILFNQAGTDLQKWIVVRTGIQDLLTSIGISNGNSYVISTSGSTPASNPLLDVNSADYAPYYLLGLKQDQVPRSNSGIVSFLSFDPFSNSPQFGWPVGLPPYKPDLKTVKEQFLLWLKEAQNQVTNEFAAVLQSDPARVLSDGATPLGRRAPVKSLKRVSDFLEGEIALGSGVNQKIYSDTVLRLKNILSEVDLVVNQTGSGFSRSSCDEVGRPLPLTFQEAAARALACIYKQAQLEYGTVFIQGRIERSVRIKLNALLLSGQISNPALSAKLLASDDILKDLSAYSGSSSLLLMTRDAEKSQEITNANLQGFVELFGKNISQVLKRRTEMEKQLGASGKSYAKSRAEMCLMLLAVPEWPKNIPRDFCLNVQLPSVFPGGPQSITLTANHFTKPHSERACHYRDYQRESLIYQNYRTELDEAKSGVRIN